MTTPVCKACSASCSTKLCSTDARLHLPRLRPRRLQPCLAKQTMTWRWRPWASAHAHAAALSRYRLERQPGWMVDWFQLALRNIVQHAERAPFLQLVQLRGLVPKFNILPVTEALVPVPQLWQGVAEHLGGGSGSPDVVILVQQVPSSNSASWQYSAALTAATALGQPTCYGMLCAPPLQPSSTAAGAAGHGMQDPASIGYPLAGTGGGGNGTEEEAARQQPGGSGAVASTPSHHVHSASHTTPSQLSCPAPMLHLLPLPPYPKHPRHRGTRSTAHVGGNPCLASGACYYGVVVQSSQGSTGAEGTYLLKTLKSGGALGGPSIYFSLTRVGQGRGLEEQFVRSWLL